MAKAKTVKKVIDGCECKCPEKKSLFSRVKEKLTSKSITKVRIINEAKLPKTTIDKIAGFIEDFNSGKTPKVLSSKILGKNESDVKGKKYFNHKDLIFVVHAGLVHLVWLFHRPEKPYATTDSLWEKKLIGRGLLNVIDEKKGIYEIVKFTTQK